MMPCTLTDRAPEPLTESTALRTSSAFSLWRASHQLANMIVFDIRERLRRLLGGRLPVHRQKIAADLHIDWADDAATRSLPPARSVRSQR